MFEKAVKNDGGKYVSCIKINGTSILPPLMTHAKRKEIHRYKQQAIKLEKRLKRERELRQYIDKYYIPLENCANLSFNSTLEHRLSFEDDVISQTHAIENELKEIALNNGVPSIIPKERPCLSSDLQVSQYANNEFTVLMSFRKCKSDIVAISEFSENDPLIENIKDKDKIDQRPRLIRSNSYILESPSPMLLDHLRKQQELNDKSSDPVSLSEVHNDEQGLKEKQSNISNLCPYAKDNGYIFYEGHDAECSISTGASKTESELKNISNCLSDAMSNDEDHTLLENKYQLKAFIDNNVPQIPSKETILSEYEPEDVCAPDFNNLEDSSVALSAELSCYNEQSLKQILNKIPDVYSRKILEFLDKQKQESLVSSLDCNDLCEKIISYDQHSDSSEIDDGLKNIKELRYETALNCSRELFPINDKGRQIISKQEYAASIIGAAAKGYLVRRLMRTDRVQGLIQTIREALMCAMQLHSENTENINESDVELHRRLIQQVSAACYEFYDVFFTLSTLERLTIIRLDRERQKEKLKRPLSRVSSASLSSRSSRSITK